MITHNLSFGKFEIHANYMVGELAQGVDFDLPKVRTIIAIAQEHFVGPFAYIGNRIHSYSVDPRIYSEVGVFADLKAIGVVTYRPATFHTLTMERSFLPNIPVGTFFNVDDAVNWAQALLRQEAIAG